MRTINGTEIDEKKATLLLRKIILLEKQNSKTKQLNSAEMVKKIKKIIEEEVGCY